MANRKNFRSFPIEKVLIRINQIGIDEARVRGVCSNEKTARKKLHEARRIDWFIQKENSGGFS